MEYIIEKAKASDLNDIYILFLKTNIDNVRKGNLMWARGYPTINSFKEDLDNDKLYVMKDGENIIATMGVYLDPVDYFFFKTKDENKLPKMLDALGLDKSKKSLVLERLMVDPDLRGKGLGKKMMNGVTDLYKEYNCLAAVFHEDDHLKPFYEKLGFRIVDPYLDWEWGKPEGCYLIGK